MAATVIAGVITAMSCIICFLWALCLKYCRKDNFGVLYLIFIAILFILYVFLQWKVGKYHKMYRLVSQNVDNATLTNQQEDIYNISSRVQGQGPWPTHDAHVSLDNFTITNELNKYNDDPPTYEEAMNIAASQNNNVASVPAVVPKTTSTPTSTGASTTN